MTNAAVAQLFDLTDKGAVVTGAALGIGQAIAFRLAEAGAGVIIADIDLEAANGTAEQIVARGGKARAVHADASSAEDAGKVIRAATEAFGGIDILVNNAGIYPATRALEISEEMWDRVLDINVKGVYFYSQAAAQDMIRAGRGGKIVNIASIGGLHPSGRLAHYDTSKSAVIMLTKGMALELGGHGVLVNAVAPGAVATPGTEERFTRRPPEQFMSRLPLGRLAEPDDIAKVVLFLASKAADYMTGSVVVVDGGYLLA